MKFWNLGHFQTPFWNKIAKLFIWTIKIILQNTALKLDEKYIIKNFAVWNLLIHFGWLYFESHNHRHSNGSCQISKFREKNLSQLNEKQKFYMSSKYAKFQNLGPNKTSFRRQITICSYGPSLWWSICKKNCIKIGWKKKIVA